MLWGVEDSPGSQPRSLVHRLEDFVRYGASALRRALVVWGKAQVVV